MSGREHRSLPIVPWLPPVLRRVWRAPGELQIGSDPARAIVLQNVGTDMAAFVNGLDGTRTTEQVLGDAEARSGATTAGSRYSEILGLLFEQGLVVDLADNELDVADVQHPLLLGPLAAEVHGRSLGTLRTSPTATMLSRGAARVLIVGGRRLGPAVAAVLAAGGVRRIALVQPGAVTATDLVPGGPAVEDIGRSRIEATCEAITRIAPGVDVQPLATGDRPDLVVLADSTPADDERARALMQTGTPFLPVAVRERRAVIGPFVLPGQSSCLSCQDAVRRDLDRSWPSIDAQLRMVPNVPGDGGEIAVVMLAASVAAVQVMQWIDSERIPETINATLEIALPGLILERRYWPRHDTCSCRISARHGQ